MTPERRTQILAVAERLYLQALTEYKEAEETPDNGDRTWLRKGALEAMRSYRFLTILAGEGETPTTAEEEKIIEEAEQHVERLHDKDGGRQVHRLKKNIKRRRDGEEVRLEASGEEAD